MVWHHCGVDKACWSESWAENLTVTLWNWSSFFWSKGVVSLCFMLAGPRWQRGHVHNDHCSGSADFFRAEVDHEPRYCAWVMHESLYSLFAGWFLNILHVMIHIHAMSTGNQLRYWILKFVLCHYKQSEPVWIGFFPEGDPFLGTRTHDTANNIVKFSVN